MRILYSLLLNSLLIFAVNFTQPLLGEEPPKVNFSFKEDGRVWKLAFKDANDNQSIFEFVPSDTQLENWVDLATIQYLQGPGIPAKVYYEKFIEALKKSAPFNKVQSKIIEEEPNSVFFEWWIADNSPLDQHEWIRVFVDGNNTAFLRYTTKDQKHVEKFRSAWEKIIGNAKFEKVKVDEAQPGDKESEVPEAEPAQTK